MKRNTPIAFRRSYFVKPLSTARVPERLRPGRKTQPGAAIDALIQRTRGKELADKVMDLGIKIGSIPLRAVDKKILEKTYGKRSAEQVLKDNVAYEIKEGEGPGGCLDYSLVACAALRRMGVPAFFAREGKHSYAIYQLGKKWYKMDVFYYKKAIAKKRPNPRERLMIELTPFQINLIRSSRKAGDFRMGRDSDDVGVRGLENYGHNAPKRKRK